MPWQVIAEFTIGAAVSVLLITVLVDDLTNYRIRNTTVLLLAVLFVVWCLIKGDLSLFLTHVLVATVVFIVLSVMYHFRLMGGGDVKLLLVAFLWLGLDQGFLFSVLLSITSLVYVVIARFRWVPSRKLNGRTSMPFGPSITVAWIMTSLLTETLPRVLA